MTFLFVASKMGAVLESELAAVVLMVSCSMFVITVFLKEFQGREVFIALFQAQLTAIALR